MEKGQNMMALKSLVFILINLIVVLIPILISVKVYGNNNRHTVLSDLTRHSYFLVFDINKDSAIIYRNSDLFFALHFTRNISYDQYIEYIDSLLSIDFINSCEFDDISTNGYDYIYPNDSIKHVADKGDICFINKFLENGIIMHHSNPNDRNYIVKILFDWSIYVKSFCETGHYYAPVLFTHPGTLKHR
jgi:hypothetical protein